jgi:hypothetical protein
MAKLTLDDLASLANQVSAMATINANNALIEAALENTLSRDGTSPNTMGADLDMNSNDIINLPFPGTATAPIRRDDLTTLLDEDDLAVTVASDFGRELIAAADVEAARTLLEVGETHTFEEYGAAPTGVADSTAAILAALDENDVITIDRTATYKISGTIALDREGQSIIGAGPGQVTFTSTSASLPMITLAAGVADYRLSGFKLTRSVTATNGGNGIENLTSTDRTSIKDIWIEKQYIGLRLASCDIGWVERVISEKNIAYGIYLTNSAAYGPAQWHMDEILVQFNTVDGIRVQVTDGPAGLILGDWTNIKTFANSGRGIIMLGSATTGIYDTRVNGAFIGSDGLAGVYMDTYGASHRFSDVFAERAGLDATGPTAATAATNTAYGFELTANNDDIQIDGGQIDNNSYSAIQSSADNLLLSGSRIYNNGASVGAERRAIVITAGDAVIIGNAIGNTNGGTSQTVGIATAVDTLTVVGNHFDGNSTAPMALGVSMVDSIIWGNRGNEAFDSATNAAGLKIRDINSTHMLKLTTTSNLTADRALTLVPGDADRTVTVGGDATISQDYSTTGNPQFATVNIGNASDTTLSRASAGRAAIEGSNLLMASDAGNLPATATNDSASAGNLGEYIESVIASGSAVSLTSTTPANMTSISLTAGDWDVDAVFQFTGNVATTVGYLVGSISTTSATLDNTAGRRDSDMYANATVFNNIAGAQANLSIPPLRFSLSGTTTIYAVAQALFATNTCSVFGILRARRVR